MSYAKPAVTRLVYPFHQVEIEDYWDGVYGGWRAILAEFLGTMMYVFVSAGLAIAVNTWALPDTDFSRALLIIALGDGLAFMVYVFSFLRISGGHLNPIITWAAIITRRIGIFRGIAYILAQIAGAIIGALFIHGATPDAYHGSFGTTFWNANLSILDGFLLIAGLCGFLVVVVFAVLYDPQHIGKLAPFPIGFTYVFSYLVGYVYVGAFLNPARALATGIVYGGFVNHWVYWIAPLVGSTIASLLYTFVFLTRPFPTTTEYVAPDYAKPARPYGTYSSPSETTRLVGTPPV